MTDSTVMIAHEDQVTLPTSTRMMVDVGDWSRVRRNVESLGEPLTDNASIVAGLAVGAAVTLVGIIASIELGSTKPAAGLLTGLWVAFAFCILIGVLFFEVNRTEKRRYRVSNLSICDDMDSVAERVGHKGLGVMPAVTPKRSAGIKGMIGRVWKGDDSSRI